MFYARRRLAASAAATLGGGALAFHERQLRRVAEADAAPNLKPTKREKVGGVQNEYKTPPRAVRKLEPPRSSFFSKEISACGIPIRAHQTVSDEALTVAADRVARMVRHLPSQVIERLSRRGASFHIIGIEQGTSELPEHRHMKGIDGGYTGEKGVTLDMRARGMGGVQSSCGEENLKDMDSDPRYAGRDILSHEFAHCIMDVGLPPSLQRTIRETHKKAVEQEGRWKRPDGSLAYAGTNASEYFAELTMWYFGTWPRVSNVPTTPLDEVSAPPSSSLV
jgi:hypothetical protein